MPDLFFEDFVPGAGLPTATLTVTAEDEAAFRAGFGRLGAEPEAPDDRPTLSGFHVAALGMRLLFDAVVSRTASLGAPGIDEVTWPNPVRVGDVLALAGRVEAGRVSASRPGMGLVSVAITISNQTGGVVMTQRFTIMVERRAGPAASEAGART